MINELLLAINDSDARPIKFGQSEFKFGIGSKFVLDSKVVGGEILSSTTVFYGWQKSHDITDIKEFISHIYENACNDVNKVSIHIWTTVNGKNKWIKHNVYVWSKDKSVNAGYIWKNKYTDDRPLHNMVDDRQISRWLLDNCLIKSYYGKYPYYQIDSYKIIGIASKNTRAAGCYIKKRKLLKCHPTQIPVRDLLDLLIVKDTPKLINKYTQTIKDVLNCYPNGLIELILCYVF